MKLKVVSLGAIALGMGLSIGRPQVLRAGWNEFDASEVAYGASVSTPSMSYNYNGVDYPAACIVTLPNGEEVSGNDLTYSMYGVYTFTYTVNVDGEIHSVIKTVEVPYPEFGVSNVEKSSISYLSAEDAKKYKASTAGSLIKLAYGDSVTFTEPISISELTATNMLLKGYIIPSTEGTADFTQLVVTLTDINDPSLYVKELYYSHGQVSSIMARSNAQSTYAGMHDSQGLHVNDTWGTWSGVSFIGANAYDSYSNTEPDKAFFTIGYDNATKTVYGTKYSQGKTMDGTVLTLDSPSLSSAFEGFKSDKVKMSISCDGYSSSTGNIVITDFRGKGAEAVKNNVFEDKEGPVITLDNDAELPSGAIGYTYPVPSATAFDEISGEAKVETRVVYNYANPDSMVDVAIVDGRFKMDKAGVYSIVYTAKDYSGNIGKLVKSISVMEQIKAPDFSLPAHKEEAAIGSYLKLDAATDLRDGCGDLTQKIYVKHDDEDEVEVKDGVRLLSMGAYTIIYEVSDMIGEVTRKSYTVNVVDGKMPILENEIAYPRYFISKGGYYIPESYAYYYVSNELKHEYPTIEITDASGSKNYAPGDLYRPNLTVTSDKVKIKTIYNGVVLQEDEIQGVLPYGTEENANALNLNNYFLGSNYDKALEKSGMRITSKGEAATIDFANALMASNASLTLSQVQGMNDGSSIKVSLIDSLNKDKVISAAISYSDSSTYLEVSGSKKQLFNNNFNTTVSSYPLTYENGAFSIGDISLPVLSYDDGTAFEGFDSERVYASISLNGQTGSSLLFESVSQYVFSNETLRDRIAPVINAGDDLGGTEKHGSTYTINPAYSFDVISPLVKFVMSVYAPDGTPAKDVNGFTLSEVDPRQTYSLVLDQYGEYYFSLTSMEDEEFASKANQAMMTYVVRVYDDKCPTASWTSTLPSTAKVGDSVFFPAFVAKDEVSSDENLTIIRSIINPKGRTTHWYDDKYDGITFQYAGVYTFRVTVFDEAGNCVSISQSVTVEE